MLAKGHEAAECPVNTLRPELRMLNGRVIKNTIGSQTLDGLQSAWDMLHAVYVHELERDVFRPKMEQKAEATLNLYDEARFVLDGPSKRKWSAFKDDLGLLLFVKEKGLDAAKHFVVSFIIEDPTSATGKRQAKRIFADLEKADYALRMGDDAPDGTPLKELYRELKRVVMAE
jgi:hypothetical protein